MGRQRPALEVPDRGRSVRPDNGPEFTSRAFIGCAQGHGIRHILIEPGRPMRGPLDFGAKSDGSDRQQLRVCSAVSH